MHPALRSALLLSFVVLWGGGCQHTRPIVEASGSPPHQHLIIDAGSSGTRFIRYELKRGPRGCEATFMDVEATPQGTPGLATLCTQGSAVDWLKGQSFKGLPRENVVLIGTGGFRRLRKEDEATYQRCWKALNESLSDRIGSLNVVEGTREGELAWLALDQQLDSPGKVFSILEIGGVSVQFATGTSRSSITSVSEDGVGMYSVAKALEASAKSSCGLEGSPSANFESCRDAVERLLAKSNFLAEVKRALPEMGARPVYGVGEAWQVDGAPEGNLSSTDLEPQGRAQCEQSPPQPRCYPLAYTSALLKVMNITTIHRTNPYPSWTRGAAVHEDYFPACRVSP
jgi:hypothetical protein